MAEGAARPLHHACTLCSALTRPLLSAAGGLGVLDDDATGVFHQIWQLHAVHPHNGLGSLFRGCIINEAILTAAPLVFGLVHLARIIHNLEPGQQQTSMQTTLNLSASTNSRQQCNQAVSISGARSPTHAAGAAARLDQHQQEMRLLLVAMLKQQRSSTPATHSKTTVLGAQWVAGAANVRELIIEQVSSRAHHRPTSQRWQARDTQ